MFLCCIWYVPLLYVDGSWSGSGFKGKSQCFKSDAGMQWRELGEVENKHSGSVAGSYGNKWPDGLLFGLILFCVKYCLGLGSHSCVSYTTQPISDLHADWQMKILEFGVGPFLSGLIHSYSSLVLHLTLSKKSLGEGGAANRVWLVPSSFLLIMPTANQMTPLSKNVISALWLDYNLIHSFPHLTHCITICFGWK